MSQKNYEFLVELLKKHSIADGYVIAYFIDQVCIGRWEGGMPILPPPEPDWKKLQQLHLFNEKEELRLIRNYKGNWLERHLTDAECKGTQNWYDEDMLIIGNRPGKTVALGANDAGFITCSEAGRSVTLPQEALGKRIRVRNYLKDRNFEERADQSDSFPSLSALQVADYRFVGFYNLKGDAS